MYRMLTRRAARARSWLWLLATALSWPALAQDEERLALVIANSRYDHGMLTEVAGAARAVAGALRENGFNVKFYQNADQETMAKALFQFRKDLPGRAVGLFYFAGHGVQINGENYLLPTGLNVSAEHDVKYAAIGLSQIIAAFDNDAPQDRLLFLDASRARPLGSVVAERRGLAAITTQLPDNMLVMTSTRSGVIGADDALLSRELAAQLNAATQPATTLAETVARRVEQISDGAQTPWYFASLEPSRLALGVIDAPTAAAAPSTVAAPPTAGADEQDLWDAINRDDPDEINAFLETFPDGFYAAQARRLLRDRRAPPSAAERAFWGSVKDSNSKDLYRLYLEQYPDGFFRNRALTLLQPKTTVASRSLDGASPSDAEVWEQIKNSRDADDFERFIRAYPASPLAALARTYRDRLTESSDAAAPTGYDAAAAPATADDDNTADGSDGELDRLLAQAENAFDNLWLLTPEPKSAVTMAKRALRLSPGNSDALRMMTRVIDRYLRWANSNLSRGQLRKARGNLGKARSLDEYATPGQRATFARLQRQIGAARQRRSVAQNARNGDTTTLNRAVNSSRLPPPSPVGDKNVFERGLERLRDLFDE